MPLRTALFLACLLSVAIALGIPARRPHAAGTTGPRGVQVPDDIDLGRLRPMSAHAVEVPWERCGPGSVRVLDVRTDCGCAVVTPLPKRLLQGACGRLPIRVRIGSRSGPFGIRVRVVTDGDPPADVATCRLRGYVDRPLAATPAALALGRRSPGAAVERRIELRWHDAARPLVTAQLSGLDGDVAIEPSVVRRRPGALLTLALHVPTRAGPFRAHLVVQVQRMGELLVPITGDVVGADR